MANIAWSVECICPGILWWDRDDSCVNRRGSHWSFDDNLMNSLHLQFLSLLDSDANLMLIFIGKVEILFSIYITFCFNLVEGNLTLLSTLFSYVWHNDWCNLRDNHFVAKSNISCICFMSFLKVKIIICGDIRHWIIISWWTTMSGCPLMQSDVF